MHPMTEMKLVLKEQALKIRTLKNSRKKDKRNGRELWEIENELYRERFYNRCNHIAYCLVRGRKYEEIETPGFYNSPNWYVINEIKDKLQARVDVANAEWMVLKEAS